MSKYRRIFKDGCGYFLTVTTHQRNPILIDNIDLLRESFRVSKQKFNYEIDAVVILPDHFHLLLTLDNAKDYPKIIGTIKSYFSANYEVGEVEQSYSRHKKRYKAVWQKRYYEHTIRHQKDFDMHMSYVENNPVKHELVEHANLWRYSSFYEQ